MDKRSVVPQSLQHLPSRIKGSSGSWVPEPLPEWAKRLPDAAELEREIARFGLNSLGKGRVKADLTTTFEWFLWGAIVISCLLIVFGVINWSKPFFLGILSFFVFLGLYIYTDIYYIIDIPRKIIFYHFDCIGFVHESEVSTFASIIGFTTTGVEKSSKASKYSHRVYWWEYATVMVFGEGKILPLSDYVREGFWQCDNSAKNLAAITKTHYKKGETCAKAAVKRIPDTDKFAIQHRPRKFSLEEEVFWGIIAIIIYLIILS